METREFKPILLLILVLPLVISVLGGVLTNQSADAFISGGGYSGVNQFDIYIGASILTGLLAFFIYWGKQNLAMASAILLPLIYTVYAQLKMGGSTGIFSYFLPIILLSAIIFLLLWRVFYYKPLARLRTFLFAMGAAVGYSVFFWLLHFLMKSPTFGGFWMNNFINGLILFVFIGFGLSIADMIISGKELKEAQEMRRQRILNDEIEDEDDL